MTINAAQWQEIGQYTRSYILHTAENFGHRNAAARASARWTHSLSVLQNVRQILDGERAPQDLRDVCEVAALMHDIDHYTVQVAYHAQRGAETAAKFLSKLGFEEAFVRRVRAIIAGHHLDLDDDLPIEELIEEVTSTHNYETRIVMDADTLDKVGVSNGLQAVMTMAQNGAKLADIAKELAEGWALQRASLWKQLLTTNTGKVLGDSRFTFYQTLAQQIGTEIVNDDPFPELSVTQEMRKIVLPKTAEVKQNA